MGTRRALLLTVVIGGLAVLGVACGGGDDDSGTTQKRPSGPAFDVEDPCTLLSASQVEKVFGEPVTVDATNNASPLTTDCAYVVGDPAAPTGRLVANVVFPAFGAGEGADALSVVESDRALAQIAGEGVFDLGLGVPGFLESRRSFVEFFVRPKLAVSLQWYPTGGAPEGTPVTEEVEADLTALATHITSRLG